MRLLTTIDGRARTVAGAVVLLVAGLAILGPLVHASGTPRHAKHRRHGSFSIKGNLRTQLRPGTFGRVALKLRNRRRHTLWVTRVKLSLGVDRRHRAAGCMAKRDFAVRQLPRRAYPIRLPARRAGHRRWRTLRSLGVRTAPRVWMLDLAGVDQDACKGATLRLRYSGRARRTRPRTYRLSAAGSVRP